MGAAFRQASNDSPYGKVFRNNMDSNSFAKDSEKNTIDRQIEFMISKSKTVMFYYHESISGTLAYKDCWVSENCYSLLILLLFS